MRRLMGMAAETGQEKGRAPLRDARPQIPNLAGFGGSLTNDERAALQGFALGLLADVNRWREAKAATDDAFAAIAKEARRHASA